MDEEFDYSQDAKAARDLFVSDFTSHIFYVEDTGAEIFYERLFERLFPKLRDFQVVCLDGKTNVRKKAAERRIADLTYIFVVDKDFDDLLGGADPNLVYLDRYSVENYLADLQALVKVLVEEYPDGMSAQKAMAQCDDYTKYRATLDTRLIAVTQYFVVARRLWLELKSSKIPATELVEGSSEFHPMPTNDWIAAYRSKVLEESGMPDADLNLQLQNAFSPSPDFPEATTTPLFHVPGKHLLYCVQKYLCARTVPKFDEKLGKALHTRILNHINIEEFATFKTRLLTKHANLADYV